MTARDLYEIVCGRTGDCHGFAEKTAKLPSASGTIREPERSKEKKPCRIF